MTTEEQQLNRLSNTQRRRFKDGRCLKCGSPITTQEYIGSFCQKCNKDFFDFQKVEVEKFYELDKNADVMLPMVQDKILFKYLRGEKFVFR